MPKNKSGSLFTRRAFFQITGLATIGTLAYSYFRGIRFPLLSWEPKEIPNSYSTSSFSSEFENLIYTTFNQASGSFRAFAPEPRLEITKKRAGSLSIAISNIANDAKLNIEQGNAVQVTEETQGITRIVTLNNEVGESISLHWQLPELDTYTFAAIGDTGGDKELDWCIQRAHQLGARFLLHLGDFNYQQGDYDNAIRLFNQAPLPCYITIGNHDFYEAGLVYEQFLNEIGPLNHTFSIGQTRFINLDTAASVLPYGGGQRGALVEEIIADQKTFNDTVVFTHRPLNDPMSHNVEQDTGDHDIGSDGERKWLLNSLEKIGATTMLCGHIHIFDRSSYQGIDSIIAGQGLGHQDLIINDDASKMAIGQVSVDGKVDYDFASLAMPMELHCHPRVQSVKDSLMDLPHSETISEIDKNCEAT